MRLKIDRFGGSRTFRGKILINILGLWITKSILTFKEAYLMGSQKRRQ